MCRGAFVHVHTDAHKRVCVHLHSCGGLSVLKWLPSKWNVPRRPWFYKETGGCREGGKERGMKREMGLERNGGGKQLSTMVCLGWVEAVNSWCIGLASVAAQGYERDGLRPVFGSRLTWRAARLTVA